MILNLIKSDYIVPSPKILLSEEKILSSRINANPKDGIKQQPQRVAILKNAKSTNPTLLDDDDPTNLASKSTSATAVSPPDISNKKPNWTHHNNTNHSKHENNTHHSKNENNSNHSNHHNNSNHSNHHNNSNHSNHHNHSNHSNHHNHSNHSNHHNHSNHSNHHNHSNHSNSDINKKDKGFQSDLNLLDEGNNQQNNNKFVFLNTPPISAKGEIKTVDGPSGINNLAKDSTEINGVKGVNDGLNARFVEHKKVTTHFLKPTIKPVNRLDGNKEVTYKFVTPVIVRDSFIDIEDSDILSSNEFREIDNDVLNDFLF